MARTNGLSVNGDRFWSTVTESGQIGPGVAGGLSRLALGDADREVRNLFTRWCHEAGLGVRIDRLGNMFARYPGREEEMPPVLVGSHLDTQVAGGRFDGIVGVLGALEAVRTLDDHGVRPRRPIEVVNWSNEEGARFSPPMSCSAVFAGLFDLEWGLSRVDPEGRTFSAELTRIGYAGEEPVGGREIDSYFELHIEQGPIRMASPTTRQSSARKTRRCRAWTCCCTPSWPGGIASAFFLPVVQVANRRPQANCPYGDSVSRSYR